MQKIYDETKWSLVWTSIEDNLSAFCFQSVAAQRLRPRRNQLSPDGWSNMYSAAVTDTSSSQKNNGDDINDDNGETFDDEDHKPCYALWSWGERLHFLSAPLAAIKITEKGSIRNKMKYEFSVLNKDLCQILLLKFFFHVFQPSFDRWLKLIQMFHIRKFNHAAYSFFFDNKRLPIMCSICGGPDTTPTKRSTIARWMIKYVLRRCSWRFFFTKTTMVMILRMTMARHSTMRTTSHGIHSEAEDKRCIFSEHS